MELQTRPLQVIDLGRVAYRDAWARQTHAGAPVLPGGPPTLFLVEHPPVITFGRRGVVPQHLLASAPRLAEMGVDVVESDRGGDVSFPRHIFRLPLLIC